MAVIEGSGIVPHDAPEGLKRELARRYLSQSFNRTREKLSLMALFLTSAMSPYDPYYNLAYNYG